MDILKNYECDGQMTLDDYIPKKSTQCQRIIDYIKKFGSITTIEAFTDLGITRLASRIHDLTVDGYDIERQTESGKNRFGETVHYTRYSLREG